MISSESVRESLMKSNTFNICFVTCVILWQSVPDELSKVNGLDYRGVMRRVEKVEEKHAKV